MPNWCSNYVIFTGETKKIKMVEDFCRGMDFNKIVPMPARLGIMSGTISDIAQKVFNGESLNEHEQNFLNKLPVKGKQNNEMPFGERSDDLSYLWTEKKIEGEITREKIAEADRAQYPKSQGDLYELGRIMNDNIKKYNAKDWLDWKYDNWGTKWNALGVNSENNGEELWYSFSTPAAPPDKILDIIAKYIVQLSGVSMKWSYSIECWGSGECVLTEEGLKYTGYREDYCDSERGELESITFKLIINEEEYEELPECLDDSGYKSPKFKKKEELINCLKGIKLKNENFKDRLIRYVNEFDEELEYVEYYAQKGITDIEPNDYVFSISTEYIYHPKQERICSNTESDNKSSDIHPKYDSFEDFLMSEE